MALGRGANHAWRVVGRVLLWVAQPVQLCVCVLAAGWELMSTSLQECNSHPAAVLSSALLLLLPLVLCASATAVRALQCAGFLPNDPQYADLLRDARVDVPALFITGHADALIPPHRSKVRWLCYCCVCCVC